MPRDYANRSKPSPRRNSAQKTKARSGGVPGWAGLLAGLALGLALAAWVYTRPLVPQRQAVTQPPPDALPAVEIPPPAEDRFTFYESLTEDGLVIPDASTDRPAQPAAAASAAEPKAARYVIEVASFRERNNADSQKASLALLGIESRVEPVTRTDGSTLFRVTIGPDSDRARVERHMAQLADNGIEGLLVRQP